MKWATWAAIYFTTWWVVLFAVLPFGVRRADSVEPGTEPGAPVRPALARKFLWTTVISAILVFAAWSVFATGLLDWRAITRPDG